LYDGIDRLSEMPDETNDEAQIYCERDNIYADAKKYERAIKNYTKAIELKPDYASAYYN